MRSHARAPIASTTRRRFVGVLAAAIAAIALALGATAASAEAPTVSIDPPTEAAYTTANVSGTVDPKDVGTWWSFETSTDGGASWSGFGFDGLAEENSGPQPITRELTGLTPGIEYQVRLVANNFVDPEVISTVESFTTLPVAQPSVNLDPVSSIAGESAHFEGQVNPNAPEAAPVSDPKVEDAFKATYRFECTPACPNTPDPQVVPAGDQPRTVSFDPTGLVPNTAYTVKLIASNAGGEVVAEQSFKTDFAPPQTQTGVAYEAETTTAVVSARLNPYGQATTYRFEYGADASYGSFAPAAPIAVGSGHNVVTVTRQLAGLQPNTTYHYRVVASNASGTREGADRTVTTATIDAEQRGYELVSPPDKAGGHVAFPAGTILGPAWPGALNRASVDGKAMTYSTVSSFADPNTGLPASYKSVRTASGWRTSQISPAAVVPYPNLVSEGRVYLVGASDDLSVGFMRTDNDFDPLDEDWIPGALGGNDIYSLRDGHKPRWESRPNGNIADGETTLFPAAGDSAYLGNSLDGTAVLFSSSSSVLGGPSLAGGWHLYVREAGQTRTVDVDSTGGPISPCGAEFAAADGRGRAQRAYTPDMGKVAFLVPSRGAFGDPSCEEPSQVYLRSGDHTIHVSASQRTVADPGGTAKAGFAAMSSDGDKVFIFSAEALTDNAPLTGVKLYQYDVSSASLEKIDNDYESMIEISDDGSRAYYETNHNGGTDPTTEFNVYEEGKGTIEVARIGFNGAPDYASGVPNAGRVSAHGTRVALVVHNDPTGETEAPATTQVYLYDAESEQLICVSCKVLDGDVKDASLRGGDTSDAFESNYPLNRALSEDGRQVIFQTASKLVPSDRNGAPDVYLWREGEVSLVSDGRDDFGSFFMDASGDGRHIFFATAAGLVGRDADGAMDAYVSSPGGGFSEPTPIPKCQGSSCHGPVAPSPPEDRVGTAAVLGSGYRCARFTQAAKALRRSARQASGPRAVRQRKKARAAARKASRCLRRVGRGDS